MKRSLDILKFIKWLLISLVVLVIVLIVAVFNIPSSVVPLAIVEVEKRGLLPPNAPKISLNDMEGTVWNGRANNTQVEVDGVTLDLGVLTWEIDKASLLERNPHIDIAAKSSEIAVMANVSALETGEVTVRGLEGRAPISVLEPWFPMLVTGDIAFVVDHLKFTTQQLLALDGILNLEYVDWVGADHNMPLGSYMAQLTLAENNDLLIFLNDFAAQLGLEGQFRMNRFGNYQFDAVLHPRPGLAPEVAQTITWLGKPTPEGSVVIKQRGRL